MADSSALAAFKNPDTSGAAVSLHAACQNPIRGGSALGKSREHVAFTRGNPRLGEENEFAGKSAGSKTSDRGVAVLLKFRAAMSGN